MKLILSANRFVINFDNSLFVVLYLFQYGLLVPLNIALGGQIGIIVFTAGLLFLALIFNHKFSYKILILSVIPLFLLFTKLPFENFNLDYNVWKEIFISYLSIGLSGIYFGSLKFSIKEFFKNAYWVSWLNLLLLFFIPFTYLYGETVNYMRLGYALLPTVIFSFYFFIKKKNICNAVLFLASFSILLIFGARGAMMSFLIFCMLYFLISVRFKIKIFFVSFSFFILLYFKKIFNFIYSVVASCGIESYSLNKYSNLLSGNSLASTSSGRDEIYSTAIIHIKENLWFGSPFSTCYQDTGSTYYHNIIIDLLVNLGLIFTFIFSIYIFVKLVKMLKHKELEILVLILFSIPFGRLMISSSYWQRPEFWLFLGFAISYNKLKGF